jgi:hypothetical protein
MKTNGCHSRFLAYRSRNLPLILQCVKENKQTLLTQYIPFLRHPDGKRRAVRTVVPMNSTGYRDRKSCRLTHSCWRFGITCYIHLQVALDYAEHHRNAGRPTWGSSKILTPEDPPKVWFLGILRNAGTWELSGMLVPQDLPNVWYLRIPLNAGTWEFSGRLVPEDPPQKRW